MEIEYIPLDSLKIEDSRYLFTYLYHRDNASLKPLRDSIMANGILQPLVIHTIGGENHIIDGFRRARIATELGESKVPCTSIGEDTPIDDIVKIILIDHLRDITSTPVLSALFVDFVKGLGLERETIIKDILPLLGMDSHRALLKKIERVAGLPQGIISFCDEKRLSLRQCCRLTLYPESLLNAIIPLKDEIHLTTSILDEMLSDLNDLIRRDGMDIGEFFEGLKSRGIFDEGTSPRERTERLRNIIRERRYPVLTQTRARLQEIRSRIKLPERVAIRWDKSLERKEVEIIIKIRRKGELKDRLSKLLKDEVHDAIEEIVDNL